MNNRETWLTAAVTALSPILEEHNYVLPEVSVGCGFPRSKKKNAIGQCFSPGWTKEGVTPIFVSPVLGNEDIILVLGTLLHELIHAAIGTKEGHGKAFRRACRLLGLAGKPTATVVEAGSELEQRLQKIAATLGDYPHHTMAPPTDEEKPKKPAGGGWIKFESKHENAADDEPYILRVSPKSLALHGPPMDPWGQVMESEDWDPEEKEEEGEGDEDRE